MNSKEKDVGTNWYHHAASADGDLKIPHTLKAPGMRLKEVVERGFAGVGFLPRSPRTAIRTLLSKEKRVFVLM